MKKLYTLLCAAMTMSTAVQAQEERGVMVLTGPKVAIDYYVTNSSTNGEWVCGYSYDGTMHAYVWNTQTNELKFITSADVDCAAMDVSNDGVVVGDYNGNAAYYKDGVWTMLPGGEGGGAWAISSNGKHICGLSYNKGKYRPASWTDDKITIYGDESVGAGYDISDDGTVMVGYSTLYNRTPTVWINGVENNFNPTDLGPFSVAEGLSPDGKKTIANRVIYDIETGTMKEIDYGYLWAYQLYNINNDGTACGYVQYEMGGANYPVLYKDGVFTNLTQHFKQLGVDFGNNMLYQCVNVSENQKRYALTCYDAEYYCLRPMFVDLDANISSREPVSLSVQQFQGLKNCKLTWNEPIVGAQNVEKYNIYRNDVLVGSTEGNELTYYDRDINYETYTYAVSAVYKNGVESVKCVPVSVTVKGRKASAPGSFDAMPSRKNDVRLFWDAPLVNLPTLNYQQEDDMIIGFGGGAFSFETAVRFRKEDLALYAGKKISHIYFYPMSRQNSWTINFYKASDHTAPIYSQLITDDLRYGVANTIKLNQEVEFPTDEDLIMGIFVDATGFGGYNTIGCVFNHMDRGYSDLLRQAGVSKLVSIYDQAMSSESGAYEYILTWPMGISLRDESDATAETLSTYKVYADDAVVAETTDKKYTLNNVTEGVHKYGIQAVYADGSESEIRNTVLNVTTNANYYKPVQNLQVKTSGSTVTASWAAPLDDDAAVITYASDNNTGGIAATESVSYSYQVATKYQMEKTRPYDQDYNITGFRFYPLANAEFTFYLYEDGQEDAIAYKELVRGEDYTLYTWNTIAIDEPITLDANKNYILVLDCFDVDPDQAPVGMDDQSASPNISDLVSTDEGLTWLSLVANGSKDANWMIGLAVQSKDVREIEGGIEGYNVAVDLRKKNSEPLKETTFSTDLSDGQHNIRVDVVYGTAGEVYGSLVTFNITSVAIERLESENRPIVIAQNLEGITVEGEVCRLSAYALNGQRVATANGNILGTSHLQKGVYILKVDMATGKQMQVKMQIQ